MTLQTRYVNEYLELKHSFYRIVTYFRICHDCKNLFCFGKYDFKLWLPVLISSSIFQLINMRNNGARKYWYVL